MVMPSMPIALSASLTSSSLNGWMIASIFFMVSRLEYIPFFAMHAEVESFNFLFLANSQSHRHVADFENDQSAHDCQRPRNARSDELVEHLARIAIHQAKRHRLTGGILQRIIHRVRGENASKQRSQSSACTVDAERVQCIVVAELRLHLRHHEITHRARTESDQQGRKGLHEARGWSDRHQSRHT